MKINYLPNSSDAVNPQDIISVKWRIGNYIPNIKLPNYDTEFSLNMLLKGTSIDDLRKAAVTPYGKNIYKTEAERLRLLAITKTILHEDLDETAFCIAEYIVMRTADIFSWNYSDSKSDDNRNVYNFLLICRDDKFKEILRFYDSDVLSCLAVTQLRHTEPLSEIVEIMFEPYYNKERLIDYDCRDSFKNGFGTHEMQAIVAKVIEAAYAVNKFSARTFLLCEKNYMAYDASNRRFDMSEMQNITGDMYLPVNNNVAVQDILSVNEIIEKARPLCRSIPEIRITENHIKFLYNTTRSRNHCYYTYAPNTATGKLSKYPLCVNFFAKIIGCDARIEFKIDYNDELNFSRGKVKITHDGNKIVIFLSDKSGKFDITRIDLRIVTGYNQTIYKK